jgi:hypothetical protein
MERLLAPSTLLLATLQEIGTTSGDMTLKMEMERQKPIFLEA